MTEITQSPLPWGIYFDGDDEWNHPDHKTAGVSGSAPFFDANGELMGFAVSKGWNDEDAKRRDFIITAVNSYDKHRALIETLTAALVDCEDYFESRSDADCDQDGFIANDEMRMLQPVRDAIAAASKEGF